MVLQYIAHLCYNGINSDTPVDWPGKGIGMTIWHEMVYASGEEEFNFHSKEWRSVRWEAIVRAHFRCERCGRRFPYGHGLTVHHIIPRAEGGKENPANLISLCNPCHNIVECRKIRQRAAICCVDAGLHVPQTKDVEPVGDTACAVAGGRAGRTWVSGGWFIECDAHAAIVESYIEFKQYGMVGYKLCVRVSPVGTVISRDWIPIEPEMFTDNAETAE